jgi:hypothetical protein
MGEKTCAHTQCGQDLRPTSSVTQMPPRADRREQVEETESTEMDGNWGDSGGLQGGIHHVL